MRDDEEELACARYVQSMKACVDSAACMLGIVPEAMVAAVIAEAMEYATKARSLLLDLDFA